MLLAAFSGTARAQNANTSAIAGVVKDTSGAVLPGVTVEAASPALIEKVRTVFTDTQGQYKIVNLLAGTYSIRSRSLGSPQSGAKTSSYRPIPRRT